MSEKWMTELLTNVSYEIHQMNYHVKYLDLVFSKISSKKAPSNYRIIILLTRLHELCEVTTNFVPLEITPRTPPPSDLFHP